jgi:hypothetical protein
MTVESFDLENVLSHPCANISNLYKCKSNAYNFTPHCTSNGKAYCAVWHEITAGRTATHIWCAVLQILKSLLRDIPPVKHLILWSDLYVPQNKKQVMTLALMNFKRNNPQISATEQKYSEAGHGNIQYVDAIYSKIKIFLGKN